MLIALAVIFLPAFFNGGRPRGSDTVVEIPPAPDVTPFEFEEAVSPAPVTQDVVPPLSEWYGGEPVGTGSNKDTVRGWVLQVASFTEKSKAETLRNNLQAKGYRAFVRHVTRDGKPVSRVLIGPEMDETSLRRVKTTVDRDFRVSSIVTKFEP